MRIGIDTSVVLRLLVGEPPAQAVAAQAWLSAMGKAGTTVTISGLVIAESCHAMNYHYGISKPEVLRALFLILDSRAVTPTGHAGNILMQENPARAKPGFVDRLIDADCLAAAESMATFEKSAERLNGAQVLQ